MLTCTAAGAVDFGEGLPTRATIRRSSKSQTTTEQNSCRTAMNFARNKKVEERKVEDNEEKNEGIHEDEEEKKQEVKEDEGEGIDGSLLDFIMTMEQDVNALRDAASAASEAHDDQLLLGASLHRQYESYDGSDNFYRDVPVSIDWGSLSHYEGQPIPISVAEAESAAAIAAASIGTCISCSASLDMHLICSRCRTIFKCCGDCYATPEVHKELTRHYRECAEVTVTPHQRLGQIYNITPDAYQWQSGLPCRNCAKCENDTDGPVCDHCQAYYCSQECLVVDRERHEADGECIKRVKDQMPPNLDAESTRTSIMIPDLLAHAISFLSLYQWGLAGQVNHAWRNATLLPSAFSHEIRSTRLDAPNIGPLHRACFRSHEWTGRPSEIENPSSSWDEQKKSDDPRLPHLREYSHLRSFRYYSYPPNDVLEILDLLPPTLISLSLLTQSGPLSVSSSIIRFACLQVLSIDLRRGSALLHGFALTALHQLIHLRELSFRVSEIIREPEQADQLFAESREAQRVRLEEEKQDIKALTDVVETISRDQPALNKLTISSYQHGLSQIFATHQLPQVTELALEEITRVDTPDDSISSLAKVSQCFPSVTSLSFIALFAKSLLFDPINQVKKQLSIDSVIACVDSFGPHLKSIHLQMYPRYQESDQGQFNDHEFKLDLPLFERVFTHCTGVESLRFQDRHAYLSEMEVAILARFTPRIRALWINLGDSVETSSTMIESLMISFPHLETLHLTSWSAQPMILSPPSPAFLRVRDSLPSLQSVSLQGFDVDTQLPALLRLLPRIGTLRLQAGDLKPWRLFEYAQYRPLILTHTLEEYDHPSTIQRLQTIDESQLSWLDPAVNEINTPILKQLILSPSFLPENLHMHYHRGCELASDNDILVTSSSSSPSSLTLPAAAAASGEYESHGWIFSRIRELRWNWLRIAPNPSTAVTIPSAVALYRDSAWIHAQPDDITKNGESKQLERKAFEYCVHDPPWM